MFFETLWGLRHVPHSGPHALIAPLRRLHDGVAHVDAATGGGQQTHQSLVPLLEISGDHSEAGWLVSGWSPRSKRNVDFMGINEISWGFNG